MENKQKELDKGAAASDAELDKGSMHWSQQLAQEVVQKAKEPYLISAGMTTSGPCHLGTLCEFLYPQGIKKALEMQGKKAKYYFVADIFDAFDGVPSVFEKYKSVLEPHLGKPLYVVPDPTGKTASFGEHFMTEAQEIMKHFGVEAQIIKINEVYAKGAFDKYAKLFLQQEEKVKEVVARTSLRKELPADWSPIMPVCEKCGRIATTRVTEHTDESYKYACDKDVKYTKGCGHKGENKLSDHKYKLNWRLHWPSWMDYFGTSIEGAGVDHHTRGGSWDTLLGIFKEIFKKEPPIGYKFGFILFEGKKYSKSKGTGMGVSQLMKLLPPEAIKYMLLKPDLQENIDINPTSVNMLRLLEDYQGAVALIGADEESMSRADRKRLQAARLSKIHEWKTAFLDVILYRQLYGSWENVAKESKDAAGVKYLSHYIEEWEKAGFIPEEYSYKYMPHKAEGKLKEFFESLKDGIQPIEIHNAVFEFAKANSIQPGDFFKSIYQLLLGKDKGPKLGKFLHALGVSRVKKDVL
ncbi:Lysine--tRNA ligase [Candidatus Anstonella stagnisolia]|nr:Lysine--tRNA ligase [Candidatus Anstonella stagnisolia]